MQDYQCRGKSYQDIDNSAHAKTESNNCFIIHFKRKYA